MSEEICTITEFVKSLVDYNPKMKSNPQLRDDFRLLAAYYSSKKAGKAVHIGGVPVSLEDIVNAAKLIYNEIESRKAAGTMELEWHPESMKPMAKELFDKVSSGKLLIAETGLRDEVLSFIQEDLVILKDAICLVGSSVGGNSIPNDIDILLRIEDDRSYLSRAIKTRLYKMFPDGIAEKLHIFHEPSGAHDDFIPLFDIVLKRKEPVQIQMSKGIQVMKPFPPIKTTQQTYYTIPDLVEELF